MDVEVRPVAITQIDWNMYLDAWLTTGKNPNSNLDAHHMKVGGLQSFIGSLIDGRDPRQVIRNEDNILKHVSASFIIKASINELILISQYLDVLILDEDLYLVSGTLLKWKYACVHLSQVHIKKHIRFIMNSCMLIFEKAELHEVWGNYRKESQLDGTFILMEKK